jgi:hypothetical protein
VLSYKQFLSLNKLVVALIVSYQHYLCVMSSLLYLGLVERHCDPRSEPEAAPYFTLLPVFEDPNSVVETSPEIFRRFEAGL